MINNKESLKRVKDNLALLMVTIIILAIIELPKEELFWQSSVAGKYIVEDYITGDGKREVTIVEVKEDKINYGLLYYGFILIVLVIFYRKVSKIEKKLLRENKIRR